jgi:anti-anti-sigma factor
MVVGEIDSVSATELRDHVFAVPDGDVILDVSGVQFLAAAGLTALLDLHDRRARAGAQLVLAAPSRPVRRVLTITGHDATLPMTATVEDAVAFLEDAPVRVRTGPPGASVNRQCAHHRLLTPGPAAIIGKG